MKTSENSPGNNDIQLDLQYWLGKLISHWLLFCFCLVLSVTGAYLYLRYASYQYSTKVTLLIKDVGEGSGISEESILISDRGLLGGGKSLDNEMQILKSIPLMQKVIEELKAHVTYYRLGKLKENELYSLSPLVLDTFSLAEQNPGQMSLTLEISDNDHFTLAEDQEAEDRQAKFFGVPFFYRSGYFIISKKPGNPYILPGTYRIQISEPERTAQYYASNLSIQRVGDQLTSSILELKLLDPVPRKAEDILNTLIEKYNEEEITDENKVLHNTIDFIDDRVLILAGELDSVEGKIAQFKTNHEIITEDAASSLDFTIEEIRGAVRQLSDLEVKKSLLASLEQFLINTDGDFELIPANLSADNAALATLVSQYNELLLRRDRLSAKASDLNPSRLALEKQMADIRGSILLTIRNLQRELEIPIAKTEENLRELRRSMSTVPNVENQLLEQMRTQSIKENLFLFLLQKREEAALSAAVTTANTRVIDGARSSRAPVQPKKQVVYLASVLLGFLLPFAFIVLRALFETRIESEDTIKRLSSIPLIGRIPQGSNAEKLVMDSDRRSAITESFRMLRTRIHYWNPDAKNSVLLITSSQGGDGKTFVTLNLGMALALSSKKVVLLGLDLRKPKLYEYFGLEKSERGITDFLIGACALEDIIYPSAITPNLFCVPSGPSLSGFPEMIQYEKVEKMIGTLKEQYDIIVIDSPPIGLVADALLLSKLADSTIIVIRHKYTRRGMLKDLEELHRNGELTRPAILFNGVKSGSVYAGYGKDSGYGYYK